jgi:hypothetical protein
MSHINHLFNALLTTFDLATLQRLARSPHRCQSALDELDGLHVFYQDFQLAIWELLEQQAGLDDGEERSLTVGQQQQALALWAIHQAACALLQRDEARATAEMFKGHLPDGVYLTPLPA